VVIRPDRQQLYLTSLEERIEQIAAIGVDLLIILPFNRDVMALTAQEFMARVCQAVALRELWIGHDFALGRGREGNLARLRDIGHELGYSAHTVEPLLLDGAPVSSTRIRTRLQAGDLLGASQLLGHSFSLRGVVAEGARRGRTIGFPTANVTVDPQHILPADGVYVCHAQVDGQRYGAVTNVGMRPTFAGTHRTVEAYLLDFFDEIYGETLRLDFLHHLRGERKFDGIAALVAQITSDVAAARQWLKERNA
jgi:riboflavin kinase/FMN adenylyltransferase